jgi:hypothetical protein
MVGYVQTDDAHYWVAQLRRRFQKDQAGKLRILQPLSSVTVMSNIENEWISEHGRLRLSNITVYHIFFDCS